MREHVRLNPPPNYHEKLLLVGFSDGRETVARIDVTGTIDGSATTAPMRSSAVRTMLGDTWSHARPASVLESMVRNGQIRRIVPLAGLAASSFPLGARVARAARASARAHSESAGALDGTSLIELETDTDAERLLADLSSLGVTDYVSRVPIRYLALPARKRTTRRVTTGPNAAALWNLKKIRWHEARGQRGFRDASEIRVAILDSGVDNTHPELRGSVKSYSWAHPDFPNASGEKDIIGHGTHVAGTAGALINGDVGISGICQCELHAWKIFDDEPDYNEDSQLYEYYVDPVMYLRALAACVTSGIHVVNLSIGGGGELDPVERRLFARLLSAGVTVVAAMGNEREDGSPISYPAAIPGVIAVGATGADDCVTTFPIAEATSRCRHLGPASGQPCRHIQETTGTDRRSVPVAIDGRARLSRGSGTTRRGTARPWPRLTSLEQSRCCGQSTARLHQPRCANDSRSPPTARRG